MKCQNRGSFTTIASANALLGVSETLHAVAQSGQIWMIWLVAAEPPERPFHLPVISLQAVSISASMEHWQRIPGAFVELCCTRPLGRITQLEDFANDALSFQSRKTARPPELSAL